MQVLVILFLILRNIFQVWSERTVPPRFGKEEVKQVPLTNEMDPPGELAAFEKTLSRFLKKWEIPGASIAIARDGRLVYARGIGLADVEDSIPAEPCQLFRLASISKLVTATAIFRLIEEGKLRLDSRVFGPEGILDTTLYPHIADTRVMKITVRHLLEHSGGWTTRYGDQMFMPEVVAGQMDVGSPPTVESIIAFALGKKLHFTPGTWSSYSNLGYAILGEVVEEVSGMSYEDYVRTQIMLPLGITSFWLAGNTREEARPGEVRYYETDNAMKIQSLDGSGALVPRSDGGNDVHALGGAGGWIATAPDLLKFVLAIDGEEDRPDILSLSSVWNMTYGSGIWGPLGWRGMDRAGNWWRTGSFAGSSGVLEKQHDGTTWVILMNASAWKGADFPIMVRTEMHQALRKVDEWPGRDLFIHTDFPAFLAGLNK